MTTRTPPTPEDLAGTSERGKAAYQERLKTLRRMGIPLPAGAVIDEEQDRAAIEVDWDAYVGNKPDEVQ